MKYIRTKDSIVEYDEIAGQFVKDNNWKVANTIEELCDEKVAIRKSNHKPYLGHFNGTFLFQEDSGWLGRVDSYETIYGAIWTDKGLIFVAKMNDKGELDLL